MPYVSGEPNKCHFDIKESQITATSKCGKHLKGSTIIYELFRRTRKGREDLRIRLAKDKGGDTSLKLQR